MCVSAERTSGVSIHGLLQDLEVVPEQLSLGNSVAVPKMAASEPVEVVARVRSLVQSAQNSSSCDRATKR